MRNVLLSMMFICLLFGGCNCPSQNLSDIKRDIEEATNISKQLKDEN